MQEEKKIFDFSFRDGTGLIKIKAFDKEAEQCYEIIKPGNIYEFQYARVTSTIKPKKQHPLKYEPIWQPNPKCEILILEKLKIKYRD